MKSARTSVIRLIYISQAIIVTLIVAGLFTTVTATAAKLNPGPSLPPRPSVTTPAPKKETAQVAHSRTARIELTVADAEPGAWSVAQWRDGDGNWRDVDGWRAQ